VLLLLHFFFFFFFFRFFFLTRHVASPTPSNLTPPPGRGIHHDELEAFPLKPGGGCAGGAGVIAGVAKEELAPDFAI
jgi:hypothetical protein